MIQRLVLVGIRVPNREAQLETFLAWAMGRPESRYGPPHELVLIDANWALQNKPLTQ